MQRGCVVLLSFVLASLGVPFFATPSGGSQPVAVSGGNIRSTRRVSLLRHFSLKHFGLAAFTPAVAHAYTYVHEVLPGEHLKQIAKRYRTSVKRIRRERSKRGKRSRRARAPRRLRAGDKLVVRTRARCRPQRIRAYRTRKGDTLGGVARRFRMKLAVLRRLNAGVRPASLQLGQPLRVVVHGRCYRAGGHGARRRARMGRGHRGRGRGVHRRRFFQLGSGPGYHVRNPDRAWGTFLTLTRMVDVFSAYVEQFPDAPSVQVHDISVRWGGYLWPHRSHRQGRDVDIVFPVYAKYASSNLITAKTIDMERAWFLVKSFIETGDVKFIFMSRRLQWRMFAWALRHGESKRFLHRIFQYPSRNENAIIRHEPGHERHFHVRFRREGPGTPPPNA